MTDIAQTAALMGEPSRARMLAALLDGRALSAGELAEAACVTPATASGHLAKLAQGRLVTPEPRGRRRYYRLASPEVARMLEAVMAVANPIAPVARRTTPRIDPQLREARACYDHLAGRLGVALADVLVGRGALVLGDEAAELTSAGRTLLLDFGVDLERPSGSRRAYCLPCLDWTERRPHIAGHLGAALLQRLFDIGWLARSRTGRALQVLPAGRLGLRNRFGLEL